VRPSEGGEDMAEGWSERRKYPRFHVTCPISFVCFDKLRIGETSDLSEGGMKIQSRYILFTGETYDFTVVMNGRSISPSPNSLMELAFRLFKSQRSNRISSVPFSRPKDHDELIHIS
jgi:hypothetical protein